jgi:hypothetical protein
MSPLRRVQSQIREVAMRTLPLLAALAVAALLALTGCGPTHSARDTVPSLDGGSGASGSTANPTSGSAVGTGHGRPAALHAAAECIRTHGVPTYQDPVLTADGHVYTDSRSVLNYASTTGASKDDPLAALRQACGRLFTAAGLAPADEPPAPPQLVQAGVAAARCLRAHGLPNYRDPDSSTVFTPGHGFGITSDELPNNGAGGKQDPTFQRAMQACRSELDAEIRASQLSSLAHD